MLAFIRKALLPLRRSLLFVLGTVGVGIATSVFS